KPLTIRLLDIGGDKPVPFLRFPAEANPLLGKRGVRLLLEYPQLAQTQLAALLQLSQERQIRVLVPMVTLEDDIRTMRELFDHMSAAGGIRQRPPCGAMVETPAAALSVPAIAKYVDFLTVGSSRPAASVYCVRSLVPTERKSTYFAIAGTLRAAAGVTTRR